MKESDAMPLTNRVLAFILPVVMLLELPNRSPRQVPPGSRIDFGQQTNGTTGAEIYVTTICCGGSGESFNFTVSGQFRRGASITCGMSLPSGRSCTFYVLFAPQQVGTL